MAYKWAKKKHKLTKEMKERGVVFASRLDLNGEVGVLHQVGKNDDGMFWTMTSADKETVGKIKDEDGMEKYIDNLKDVEFFVGLAVDMGGEVEEHVWS